MFKIQKERVFTVKWIELEKNKNKLEKVSGLYCFHMNGRLLYVGKTEVFWNRFGRGYMKENSKVHKNPELMKLVLSKPEMIEIVFAPMDKEILKEQETLFIQTYIPQYNVAENPRYQIRSIQRVIARIVNKTNRLWTFTEMRDYLFHKWRREVPIEMIETALSNKTGNLSRICSTNQQQEMLMPKKISA